MSTQPGASPTDANHQRIPRLATAGHTLMRLLWIAVTLLTVSLFAASLPDYATQMHTVCTAPPCANGQLQASQALALARLGISLDTYAASFVAFNIISSACWLIVAVLLFWRGSRDRMTESGFRPPQAAPFQRQRSGVWRLQPAVLPGCRFALSGWNSIV